jgi:hypothetical protein
MKKDVMGKECSTHGTVGGGRRHLVGKSEEKRSHGQIRRRWDWDCNVKIYVK